MMLMEFGWVTHEHHRNTRPRTPDNLVPGKSLPIISSFPSLTFLNICASANFSLLSVLVGRRVDTRAVSFLSNIGPFFTCPAMGTILELAPSNQLANVEARVTNIPPDTSQHQSSLIVVFLTLQLIGVVGSVFTILIARLSLIKRHLTWYNFLASWVISGTSYSLLLFAGRIDISGEADFTVPFGLCLFQSSLIYAAPPLCATTMLGMVMQIWFKSHSMLAQKPIRSYQVLTKIVLVLPYVLFLGIFIEALVFGLSDPVSVRVTGSGMYCNSGLAIPGRISAGVVAVVLLPVAVFEILIVISLRKHWSTFKNSDNTGSSRVNVLSMVTRVLLFSIFGVLALG
ncbi:hypothetical protein FB446DRAFT_729035, partial [Lentinula raphanica]